MVPVPFEAELSEIELTQFWTFVGSVKVTDVTATVEVVLDFTAKVSIQTVVPGHAVAAEGSVPFVMFTTWPSAAEGARNAQAIATARSAGPRDAERMPYMRTFSHRCRKEDGDIRRARLQFTGPAATLCRSRERDRGGAATVWNAR